MGQAQGAIDAARAAGADRYAAAEFTAAVEALKLSEQAVTAGDYRLALDNALTSGRRAQNAAREAAAAQARLHGEAERAMAEITVTLAEVNARFQEAERALVPARVLQEQRAALAAINGDVQKAREAVKAGDYLAAKPLLDGVKPRASQLLADIDSRATSQSLRRRR